MTDKKHSYTAMIFGALLFVVALIFLFTSADGYYGFIRAWRAGARGPAPQRTVLYTPSAAPEIKFRKFYITEDGAEQVELKADFNGWGKTPVVLTKYNKGYNEISLALAAGEYKYVFVVDGVERLDATNKDIIEFDGRPVNVKTVR